MLTDLAYRRRQIVRELADNVEGVGRFVDMGIVLHVVAADSNGDYSLPSNPNIKLRILRTHRFGGMVDTRLAQPRIVGPSQEPVVWHCSEDQERIIFHDDPKVAGQLVYGSEGAGKTTVLTMWLAIRGVMAYLGEGREFGFTAPTERRLEIALTEMRRMYPATWFTYRDAKKLMTFADGSRIRLVSTHRQSAAQGSPIQGFNWSVAARDEGQDQVDVHEDIESRGRTAKNGVYPQLITATAKDSSEWRDLRDSLLGSGAWVKRSLSIFRSPFVDQSFLANKKRVMSQREFLRRYGNPATGEVSDLPPELAVYFGWLRERNLVARPQIARDVTAAVLRGYRSYLPQNRGREFGLLLGHDPGVIYNTTEVLKLVMFGNVPTWVVVGELQTKQSTEREHAAALAKYLRETFYVNHPLIGGPLAMAFIDPHGKGDGQTDYQTHYMAFQKEGIDAFNPAPQSTRINRQPRVEMVNRLLAGVAETDGTPRLVIATDEQKRPVAPVLVDSFENLKKSEGDNNPEGARRKDETDKTHAPAALAYALWPFEQEAFTEQTIKTARAAAGVV